MDKKFNLLKALGIITIVGGHTGTNFFNWFPVYSFHIPLFMFISGYFFKDASIYETIKKKVRNLIVPFLSWNLFYGLLATFLISNHLITFGHKLSLKSVLVTPFTNCWSFVFNGPSWFIGTLFLCQIFYLLLQKICKKNISLLFVVCLLLHYISLIMASNGYSNLFNQFGLAVERVFFLLVFYHTGFVYRKKLKLYDKFSFNKLALLAIANGFIIGFFTRKITYNVHNMKFSHDYIFLHLLVAYIGILFYLQLAEMIKDKIDENDLISVIGKNTFSIMMHHQFFFWLFNTMLMLCMSNNIFNYGQYLSNIYYRVNIYRPFIDVIYLLVGILGPLLYCYIFKKIEIYIVRKFY